MAVVAISYDPVSTLAKFAVEHGISYSLLSDEASRVITRLGLLNTSISAERAAYGKPMESRHHGLPYPGSFVLDERGVVEHRRFERAHQIRPTAQTLLRARADAERAALKELPAVIAHAAAPGVRIVAWADSAVVSANQIQPIHISISIETDLHLYTEPIPDGFVPLTITIVGDDRLRARPSPLPSGKLFRIDGLTETFSVLGGKIDTQIEVFLHTLQNTAGQRPRELTLRVDVRYQPCSDTVCHPPETVQLDLSLREEPNPA